MASDGKQPYRCRIKASSGYVAIKSGNGEVKIYPAHGDSVIAIPRAKQIAVWPCVEAKASESEPESIGAIQAIDCSNNHLSQLRVNGLQSLKELNCSHNLLHHLRLFGPVGSSHDGPRDIELLDCSSNQLIELDLSELHYVRQVNCSNNQLKSLRLGKNLKRLKSLDCSKNRLNLIDLAGLVVLQCLNAIDNQFSCETSER